MGCNIDTSFFLIGLRRLERIIIKNVHSKNLLKMTFTIKKNEISKHLLFLLAN